MSTAGKWAGVVVLWVLAGCDCLGRGALEVGGETPYVRCLAADAPERVPAKLGPLRLAIEKRA